MTDCSLGVNHSIFQSTVFFDLRLPVCFSSHQQRTSNSDRPPFKRVKTSKVMRWNIGGVRCYREEKKERKN